jgi:serine/alanine adding enzyme
MNNLKKELKKLKTEKGILSRKIGEAKKNSQNASAFISQLKTLSAKIKQIENELKQATQNIVSDKTTPQDIKPPQFNPANPLQSASPELRISTDIDMQTWDSYINQHPQATIYHSSCIRNVIEQTFGHSCHYLAAVDNKNKIHGVLPLVELKSRLFGHFLVSLAFFNYGSLLYSSCNARDALFKAAEKLAIKLGVEHIEYRDCFKNPNLPSKSEKAAMLLPLPETRKELWDAIGTKVRAQIKKGQKNNLSVESGTDELVDDFYQVFAENMRDLGTPVYSKALFENMLQYNDKAQIIVLYHEGKPVSAAFVIGWRNTLEIPWASTLRSANALEANMVLYWEVLQYAILNNYQVFDFGRSSKEANTYRFKKQWGAKPHELHWHYWLPGNKPLPQINPNNPKFKLMISVWQKLPVWLTKIIGPPVVKNLP